jgi:hypothetical protein
MIDPVDIGHLHVQDLLHQVMPELVVEVLVMSIIGTRMQEAARIAARHTTTHITLVQATNLTDLAQRGHGMRPKSTMLGNQESHSTPGQEQLRRAAAARVTPAARRPLVQCASVTILPARQNVGFVAAP